MSNRTYAPSIVSPMMPPRCVNRSTSLMLRTGVDSQPVDDVLHALVLRERDEDDVAPHRADHATA